MSTSAIFVLLIAIFGVVIATAILVTHKHVKPIYEGLNFFAYGVIMHLIALFIYSRIITDINWIVSFFGNGCFLFGTLSLVYGVNLFVNKKLNYKRYLIVLGSSLLLNIFFFFIKYNMVIRQYIFTITAAYLFVEIIIMLLRFYRESIIMLVLPLYLFSIIFLALMIIRIAFISMGKIHEIIPGQTFTYNMLIVLIGATAFIILGFSTAFIVNYRTLKDLQTERENIEIISLTDYLTGLPNRRKLEEYAKTLISKSERFAVIFIDFDEFKHVNDVYGHRMGDKVLIEFAKKILPNNMDNIFTARYGGDEFISLVKGYDDAEVLKRLVDEKIKGLASNIEVNGIKFKIKLSVGVAFYPAHGKEIYEVIHKADKALNHVKVTGKNNIAFYED